VEIRVAAGDVVIAVHLRLEFPMPPHLGLLLLGNNNSKATLGLDSTTMGYATVSVPHLSVDTPY